MFLLDKSERENSELDKENETRESDHVFDIDGGDVFLHTTAML